MPDMNREPEFDKCITDKLKSYVYVLKDPRTGHIFYVGKGGADGKGNDRVQAHFEKPGKVDRGDESAKTQRIHAIWKDGKDVEWLIVRHGLDNAEIAHHVEAALIDALNNSGNEKLLNIQDGHHVADHGLLRPADVWSLAARPFDPTEPLPFDTPANENWLGKPIFIFPVHNALDSGDDPYTATRRAWRVNENNLGLQNAIAVGVQGQISQGIFKIDGWNLVSNNPQKFGFDAQEKFRNTNNFLNYSKVIHDARGYFMRGNYIIVEFRKPQSENLQIRYIRGCANHEWQQFPLPANP